MELYKTGKVVSIGKTYIILDSNYTGHIVYVAKAQEWEEEKDKVKKVYLYEHTTEYVRATYGFKSFNERVLFEDLLSVSGVGPKTALNILREGFENVITLIAQAKVKELSEIPLLGLKASNQIVFELKGKYEKNALANNSSKLASSELRSSLKTLGFNPRQIDYAVANVKSSGNIEQLIEEAIKAIANAKFA